MFVTYKSIYVKGHDALVNSVSVNNSLTYALTCSEDNTAKIWDLSSTEKLLIFDKVEHNLKQVI